MENSTSKQPLLPPADDDQQEPELSIQDYLAYRWSTHSFVSSFVDDGDDIPPIISPRRFFKAFTRECKKLWYLAGPAIFTSICQYSLGAITQTFAGHVGTLDLAAFSIENNVIAVGMGSALENAVRASVRGWTNRDAGRLYAKIVGYPSRDGLPDDVYLHLCVPILEIDRPSGGYIAGGGEIRPVDDSSALRLRFELPDRQVLAGPEQDHGDGLDLHGGAGVARTVQLAADAETRVGNGGRRSGAERVLVVHSGGAGVYIFSGTCGRAWSGFSWRRFRISGVS
ncbi:UNVERIFIED_CONTAM: protein DETOXIFICATION 29 [Sesamum angustifolium]|uniref:Protein DETOXIFICATION 29 n=1 Tax=Sesamum angustifolium TaxID=2727405 RepID=A0AAW2Q8P6_9LAMI